MKRTALMIMAITLVSKIIGFGRELLLSYFYGASNVTDAYLIAITIPSVILGFVIQSVASIYIPQYSGIENVEGREVADKYTSNLINIITLLLTLIVIVSVVFTEPLIKIFASGFEGKTFDLTVRFTRISIFSVYFIFLTRLFSAYLQIKNSFIITSLIGIPHAILLIISLILSVKIHIIMLPIGIVAAATFQLIFLTPLLLKKGYKHKILFDFRDENIRKMTIMSVPVMMGLSVNQINVLVDRTIASRITEGGISSLMYARYLNDFMVAIFVLSLTTVIFPNISKLAAANNMIAIKKSLKESITTINIIIIPATVGFMVLASPIVSLIYKRGAFDATALTLTSSALFFYSIGMLGASFRTVLSKFFFSLGDTKTPNLTAIVAMVINIILNIILSKYLGIGGLALATSIAAIVSTGLMFISLRKKIGSFGMRKISISFLKILFASLVMGGLAKLSFNYLTASLSQNLSLLHAIGVGGISYFVIIYFMKIEDVDIIVGAIKKKLGRGAA